MTYEYQTLPSGWRKPIKVWCDVCGCSEFAMLGPSLLTSGWTSRGRIRSSGEVLSWQCCPVHVGVDPYRDLK